MTHKWTHVSYGCSENPGVFDTGNGAMASVYASQDYPDIEKVVVKSYCGRGGDHTYYRRAEDANGAFVREGATGYDTLREIKRAAGY